MISSSSASRVRSDAADRRRSSGLVLSDAAKVRISEDDRVSISLATYGDIMRFARREKRATVSSDCGCARVRLSSSSRLERSRSTDGGLDLRRSRLRSSSTLSMRRQGRIQLVSDGTIGPAGGLTMSNGVGIGVLMSVIGRSSLHVLASGS